MIIAIDGTAGVGKGTLAHTLGKILDFSVLDTGLLYRGVAYSMIAKDLDLHDQELAKAEAINLSASILESPLLLRTLEIAKAASLVSSYKGVRDALLQYQRNFAHDRPGGVDGAILDGRDIGSFVCPDADVKIFLWAKPEIRAKRRHLELSLMGENIAFEEVFSQIIKRDLQDSTREFSPLKMAQDAHFIDTSDLTIGQVVDRVLLLIRQRD